MYREASGRMDTHITHDLSRKMNVRKSERVRPFDDEIFITSKIEIMNSSIKGVQL